MKKKRPICMPKNWLEVHLPRIIKSSRPNSHYIDREDVRETLNQLANGLRRMVVARPIDPLSWLLDYLRQEFKLRNVEMDVNTLLVVQMHKKRRSIETSLHDTSLDERECKKLICQVKELQDCMELPEDELYLTEKDLSFATEVKVMRQQDWSINPVGMEDEVSVSYEHEDKHVKQWIENILQSQQSVEAYIHHTIQVVTKALVKFQLLASTEPAQALVACIQEVQTPISSTSVVQPLNQKTHSLLRQKLEACYEKQSAMHEYLDYMRAVLLDLENAFQLREQSIKKLQEIHVTIRTQAIMDGTPIILNNQKHWILPGYLLEPATLSLDEQLAFRRAERYLMEQDEKRWRYLLYVQERHDASVFIQRVWRGRQILRVYKVTQAERYRAAVIIQRSYLHYLFWRAIKLPDWCVIGQEVVIAPSIAMHCAIHFEFYKGKDFPTGNYARMSDKSVAELMEVCRDDDECAGFATDGSLKRFLPRKLSQLHPMENASDTDGLYMKIYPKRTAKLINTAIITHIPEDRFGMVEVTLDGVGMRRDVPVEKLSNRWKRIRVPIKQRRQTRLAFVCGKVKEVEDHSGNQLQVADKHSQDLHNQDDEDEEDSLILLKIREKRRFNSPDAGYWEYMYRDEANYDIVLRLPKAAYSDDDERRNEIENRIQEYMDNKAQEWEAKKVTSAIRLQCAWRSRRARRDLQRMIQIRAKEKEHERLVNQVGINHRQQKNKSPKKEKFRKWFR